MLDPKVGKTLALISQIGIHMIVPILMMGWIGNWLAEKYQLLLLFPIFLFLGAAGGIRSVYSLIEPLLKADQKGKKNHETDK